MSPHKDRTELRKAAEHIVEEAIVQKDGRPIGTVACTDHRVEDMINYDQIFVRDGVVTSYYFLLTGREQRVADFLSTLASIRYRGEISNCFRPPPGSMPVSFKITEEGDYAVDYGEQAIARVSPVDSVLWWIILLRAYHRSGHDPAFVEQEEIQSALRDALHLLLTPQTTLYPVLFVPDGSFMIDRRLGVYGHPIEVQVLFHSALAAACGLLNEEEKELCTRTRSRCEELRSFVNDHYWLDSETADRIHHYRVEGYGGEAQNPLNIQPEDLPRWTVAWLRDGAGYLAGNVGPGRLDARFFTSGNLLAGPTGMINSERHSAILNLLEAKWDVLASRMPLKLCYPASFGRDWVLFTGRDPKNAPWSYQNGGSWPMLVWHLALASLHGNRPHLLERALEQIEARVPGDEWPEFYDGEGGDLVGRRSRLRQTWTAAGYLLALHLLENPEARHQFGFVPCS